MSWLSPGGPDGRPRSSEVEESWTQVRWGAVVGYLLTAPIVTVLMRLLGESWGSAAQWGSIVPAGFALGPVLVFAWRRRRRGRPAP